MNLKTWMKNGRRGKTPDYLALPLELEDGRPARFYGRMMRYCVMGAIAAGASAWMTPVRELAIAPGQIMPVVSTLTPAVTPTTISRMKTVQKSWRGRLHRPEKADPNSRIPTFRPEAFWPTERKVSRIS